jgi:iron transport multicopper oxidase
MSSEQVNQPGTYWYHSHNRGQYPDGFRGALIIHDPSIPYQYDKEEVLVLSDWYHKQIPDLIPGFLSTTENPQGAEPVPNSAVLNDSPTASFSIRPGKTYLFRIIKYVILSKLFPVPASVLRIWFSESSRRQC